MSRPKTMIKQSKKKKKEQILEDADDYLAAGVEHEESAGKWRAGDATKSLRFFYRAIEIYDQGLLKYSRNLDLAYNKARVELEIATHPTLVRHADRPLTSVLEAALISHRYALDLDPNNADTLFNTAQVLVSIAEALAKDDNRTNDALQFLEEALEMQNRCLSVQELEYEETEQQRRAMVESQGQDSSQPAKETASPAAVAATSQASAPSSTTAAAEDQWFSVLSPTTPDTLIETILAQISTLTTICSIIAGTFPAPATPTLAWLGSYPEEMLTSKLPALAADASAPRLQEIALTKGNFMSRLLEAGFRHLTLDASTYHDELTTAFAVPELQLQSHPSTDALTAHAEALILYATALAETPNAEPAETSYPFAPQRWAALSAAVASLTRASKLPALAATDTARTHFLRGDASLHLYMLGQAPISFPAAVSNATQLLKNAEVFYRNASRLQAGENENKDEDDAKAVAGLRSTVAQVLQGKSPEAPLGSDTGREEAWVREQVAEMVEEGLVPSGFMGIVAA